MGDIKIRPAQRALILPVTLNVVIDFILTPTYGMAGAAIASATSVSLWKSIMAYTVMRRFHLNPTIFAHGYQDQL